MLLLSNTRVLKCLTSNGQKEKNEGGNLLSFMEVIIAISRHAIMNVGYATVFSSLCVHILQSEAAVNNQRKSAWYFNEQDSYHLHQFLQEAWK